jgi:excinuclease ABC subunit C
VSKSSTNNFDNTNSGDPAEFEDNIQSPLNEKLANIPTDPGIYQYKNTEGTVIYVGKAKNLRNRVRSYFQQGRDPDAKTRAMVNKIADIEFIIVDSEAEALILEDNLIKKLKPRYNILLRDDKSFPYIRVTNEPYPRIFKTRKIIRDGSKYFGPFTEQWQLKQLIAIIRNMLQVRTCNYPLNDENVENKKYKLCLQYYIKKCEGPCQGLIERERYNLNIKHAIQILNGKNLEVENFLEKQMTALSESMRFEEAALIRNRLQMLKEYDAKQKIVTTDIIDRDVVALAKLEESACTLIFKIRDGKLIGKRHYIITDTKEQPDGEILQTAIEKWLQESEFAPDEIIVQSELDNPEFIVEWLQEKFDKSPVVYVPKIGDKKKLVSLAHANAEFILRDYHIALSKREQTLPRIILSLQRDLRMKKPPRRIECFDNSHIQGSELVSSMVVFVDGKSKKSDYRKFRIKTVTGSDDFAAMREVVERRYSRIIEEKQLLPDLIIIDGGKGQLSSAIEVLRKLNIEKKVTIISLAKRIDEIFFPYQSESLILPKSSSSLRIIQQLRDEAHRFAITYHRQLRSNRTLQTELTEIEGIGKKTAEKLLKEFGSVEEIRKSSLDVLEKSVSNKLAKSIFEHFNS